MKVRKSLKTQTKLSKNSKPKIKKSVFQPSTIVIPSDKKGLLRALVQALAELRSGNTSMQNLVVPLAHEAQRKWILPTNLFTPEELTWVYAQLQNLSKVGLYPCKILINTLALNSSPHLLVTFKERPRVKENDTTLLQSTSSV